MNTVSNDCFNREITSENQTSPPKGIGEVGEVFQTRFFGGDGVSKDTRLSLRSARSYDTTRPQGAKGFKP